MLSFARTRWHIPNDRSPAIKIKDLYWWLCLCTSVVNWLPLVLFLMFVSWMWNSWLCAFNHVYRWSQLLCLSIRVTLRCDRSHFTAALCEIFVYLSGLSDIIRAIRIMLDRLGLVLELFIWIQIAQTVMREPWLSFMRCFNYLPKMCYICYRIVIHTWIKPTWIRTSLEYVYPWD